MPVFKDEKTNTWYVKCYYTDYTGETKQKKKRGFKLQREAKDWERTFLDKQAGQPTIIFSNFVDLYFEDMTHRLKAGTILNKKMVVDTKISPYFKEQKLNAITASDIRKWQTEMMQQGHSPSYLKVMHTQFSALFNYAVKYYGLHENPCRKAGSMGSSKSKKMQFWTISEFQIFILEFEDKFYSKAALMLLFWTGIRIGELMALTANDFDFKAHTVTVTKSYNKIKGKEIIDTPKTANGERIITLPVFICDLVQELIKKLYDPAPNERLFTFTRQHLFYEIEKGCHASGVKRIRLHDLRHSHASLLIELGYSPLLISERLGHDVTITLKIYGHLYPHKHEEVANKLEALNSAS